MFDYDLINDSLEEYLEDVTLDDLKCLRTLTDIILRNPTNKKEKKYCDYVPIEDSTTLAYSFLLSLKDDYAAYFEKRLNQGTFYIDEQIDIGQSYYNYTLGKRIVEIPLTNTIEDSFVMIHEILHDMNMKYTNPKACRMLFTETISMLGELLYKDFLIKYNLYKKDRNKPIVMDFINLDIMANTNDFELKICEQYLENGYVNINFLKDLYSYYDKETVEYSIFKLKEDQEMTMDVNQRYMIGGLISCYMHDRIKNNSKYINELFETNSIMNDVYFDDLMDYLDLKYDEELKTFAFTNETLEKLEKCYKKELTLL